MNASKNKNKISNLKPKHTMDQKAKILQIIESYLSEKPHDIYSRKEVEEMLKEIKQVAENMPDIRDKLEMLDFSDCVDVDIVVHRIIDKVVDNL